jgi:hypothetical protein
MLDDLRKSTLRQESSEPEAEEPSLPVAVDDEEEPEQRFLGMTAVERMFISIFFFLAVSVIGAALLLATGRWVLGI